MAWRMLMTPTLPAADELAGAGDCAQEAAVLKTHAAARATVRVNIFRDRKAVNVFCDRKAVNVFCDRKAVNVFCDRKAVNVFCDRKAVNNLEFTFFSLLWSATVRLRRTRAKSAWLKIDSAPSGLYERIANL